MKLLNKVFLLLMFLGVLGVYSCGGNSTNATRVITPIPSLSASCGSSSCI